MLRLKFTLDGGILIGLATLLAVATLAVYLFPGLTPQGRDNQRKMQVAQNLHDIGSAILKYQGDDQQLYPRTIVETPTTLPTTRPTTAATSPATTGPLGQAANH